MKAIVLAAGIGKRLRPLTEKIPKVMIEIKNKPVLEYNLLNLKKCKTRNVYINLHYKPETIRNYFSDGRKFGLKIRYSLEEKLLGSAGAVKKIAGNFRRSFLVVYGDNFTDFNLRELIIFHRLKKAKISIALFNKKVNPNSGIAGSSVKIDKRNRVVEFTEGKNITDLSSAGIYVLSPEILNYIPAGKFFDFGYHLFPLLLRRKIDIYGCLMKGFIFGVDNINCYNKARKFTERYL